ncbi:hypothetical protein LR48_Vigan01g278100 [Vigna angularis]|uniref:Transposase (putative) gypsy type domain-containing protein n=1 Tax=Phaseolus angularis TaxID=3914 RepID=A0A0L9TRR2_PHAAN|nr:hypothetical protein LR48_Vigan01g278100 [Vigna angularis]
MKGNVRRCVTFVEIKKRSFPSPVTVPLLYCELILPPYEIDSASIRICQVNLNPFSLLVCLLPIMEEKGQNARVDTPGPSLTAEHPEITTILSGENAFLYGNVLSEGPEECATSTARGGDYDWATREVNDFSSLFRNRVVLEDWVENSCILRTLGYSYCIKLVAYREDERVFHGRENATNDFFYCYAPPFYDLYVRLPLTIFQMDVLRTLNVAPSQLHPDSWGYIQAVAVICQALAIRPIVALFLHFFRCRLIARKGWVSLISEPGNALLELYSQSYRGFKDKFFKVLILDSGRTHFFDEDGNPKFPLYWTQDPLRFTSWAEDKMTIDELEALSVLTALPCPFSSRRLINCLEHVDFDSRVFALGKETKRQSGRYYWRRIKEDEGDGRGDRSSSTERRVGSLVQSEPLNRVQFGQLRKESGGEHDRATNGRCHVRIGESNSDGCLAHGQKQSERLMCEAQVLLNGARSVGLALKKERDDLQRERDQVVAELEQSKKTVATLTKERDDLRAAAVSTEGVAFDVRKDVYEGQMRPLGEIPENAFLEAEDGVGDEAVAVEEPKETAAAEEPIAETAGESSVGSPNIVID